MASGFDVKQIAKEGEEFPVLGGEYKNEIKKTEYGESYLGAATRGVSSSKLQGKDYVAVSIEKPESSQDHNAFWTNLEALQNEIQPSSQPAVKS